MHYIFHMNMKSENRIPLSHLYPVIAGCGLVGTCYGMGINISGNFFTPVAETFGIGRGDAAMTLTVYNLVFAFCGLLAPWFHRTFRFRYLMIFGTLLQAGSTFLLAFCNGILPMYALNAVRGFGSGIIGSVAVTMMINYWFARNTALVTSIAMSFSGITGAVLSPVIASIISAQGWRAAYVFCAAIILILNLPAIVLPISLHPQERSLAPFGQEDKTETAADEPERPASSLALFFLLVFAFACSVVTALPQHFPGIAQWRGAAAAGAFMISASMVSNTGGKVLIGVLCDRIGSVKASLLTLSVITIACAVLFTAGSIPVLIGTAFVYGFCFSVSVVACAVITRDLFGLARYSRIFPKVNLMTNAANAVGTWLIGYLYDGSGSYVSSLTLMLVLLISAVISLILAARLQKNPSSGASSRSFGVE